MTSDTEVAIERMREARARFLRRGAVAVRLAELELPPPPPLLEVDPPEPNIIRKGKRVRVRTAFRVYDRTRGRVIEVPLNFDHDGASVPRPVWWVLNRDECGEVAPAVHDLLYRTGGLGGLYTRAEADALFFELMELELGREVPRWKRRAAWAGVRVGGWTSWTPAKAAA